MGQVIASVSKCLTCLETASIAKLLCHGANESDEGYESDEGNEEGSHESHEGDESDEGNEESTGRRRSGCCTHEEGDEGYEGNESHESHESNEVSASRVGARLIRNLKIRLAQGCYASLV